MRVTLIEQEATQKVISFNDGHVPVLVVAAGERAGIRFLEFFASAIRNPHTRRAYLRAVRDFLAWCETMGVSSVAGVQPLHVASWIELQTRERSAPTVKLHLAALRHLFDWLVTGQVIPTTQPPRSVARRIAYARARRRCWIRLRPGSCSTALTSRPQSGCGTGR